MSRRSQRAARKGARCFARAVRPCLALALALAPAIAALACEIPVYQWALLNWEPDMYELLVFHNEPLPPDMDQALHAMAEQASPAHQALNVVVYDIGPETDTGDGIEQIRQREQLGDSPWMALRYPGMPPNIPSLWTVSATPETLRRISRSTVREQITSALLRGVSHVWVVLECGDADKDAAARERLESALPTLATDIDPETISPNAHITSEIVTLRRDDPEETLLVQTLLRSEPDLFAYEEPMVFPVFGRGRALYALVGAGISDDNLRSACAYVAGRCSCLVKDENPGVDLLLSANWEGIASATAAALPDSPELTDAALAEVIAATMPETRLLPGWYVLAALTGALMLVGILSAVFLRRSYSPSASR